MQSRELHAVLQVVTFPRFLSIKSRGTIRESRRCERPTGPLDQCAVLNKGYLFLVLPVACCLPLPILLVWGRRGLLRMASKMMFLCALAVLQLANVATGLSNGRAVMCYWGSWSVYREQLGNFGTSNMDPNICTHLIYSFAGLNPVDYTIKSLDPWCDLSICNQGGLNNYANAVALRQQNPNLKVMIAVGGWNEGSAKFSNMSQTAESRQRFIASVIKFLLLHDFDGLDIDWEYPAARGGRPEDKQTYTLLVKELRQAFNGVVREPGRGPLILTAALPAITKALDEGFELANISNYLDYLNMMTYDFHTIYDGMYLYHHAGLGPHASDSGVNATKNAKAIVEYLLSKGVPSMKIVLGIPTYGRSFTMGDANKPNIYDPAVGEGSIGPYTKTSGYLAYYEICKMIMTNPSMKVVRDPSIGAPYAYNGTFWVGYDDPESTMAKAQYAVTKNLGGAMVWAIDNDDFRDLCENVSPFPIVSAIRMIFETSPPPRSG